MERLLKLTADSTQGPYLILNQRPIECNEELHTNTWPSGPPSLPSLSVHIHSTLGPCSDTYHLLLVRSSGEFFSYSGGWTSWTHPSSSPSSPGKPRGIWEPNKGGPPPCGDQKSAPQGMLPEKKGGSSQSSTLSGLLMCAPLDSVQHSESNMHKTLMSREELVSQKSLKYDHM